MENLKLKKFTKTNARLEDRITITANRAFGFPTQFYKNNNINRHKYLVLYFDEDNEVIGFHFTSDEGEEHKFTLIKSNQGYGASVVATSFFKTYDIDPGKYKGKYNWRKRKITEVGQVFLIDLKEKEANKKD